MKISVREGYQRWARSYDDVPNAVISLIDRHLEVLPGLVIDVACGTGRWVERTGGFGVDLSIEMLARRPGRVAQADAGQLPFADGIADVTLCILALGYIWPPENAITELHRITKSGGWIIAADFHPRVIEAGWTRSFSENGVIYEIENRPYQPDGAIDLYFGEPERAIYEHAGRADLWERVRATPALWLRRWRKLILSGARVALGPNVARRLDITIRGGRIAALGPTSGGIDLSGHMILPGLINAHDHLSFNLFPLLGRPPYPNATAWARDIYRPDEAPVREHREIPREVRLLWGGLKNLISGVTTVAHHDPDPPRSFGARFPVRIAKAGWAHSLAFTPDLERRMHRTPRERPFILHLGEGTDAEAAQEISTLDRMGLLDERVVIVHGVALDSRGLKLLRDRGAALIACPVSNLYTLRQTLKCSVFSSGVLIALGTDSALTAPGDLLDALRAAKSIWNLSAARLYRMVTTEAASILRLRDGQGEICERGVADLIVVRDTGASPAQTLLALNRIEMAIVGGRIRLVSDRLTQGAGLQQSAPHTDRLSLQNRGRVLVDAPVRRMYQETAARLGTGFKLAGRRVRIR